MLEQNKKTEVLSEIESFVNRLDQFAENESKYDSEAIKSLNNLIENRSYNQYTNRVIL